MIGQHAYRSEVEQGPVWHRAETLGVLRDAN